MNIEKEMNEFKIQDSQYYFPYHYIPEILQMCKCKDENQEYEWKTEFRMEKTLGWGFEYLTYMNEVIYNIKKIKPHSLIDVGCGDGRLIHLLNQRGFCEEIKYIKGIDISEQAISLAKLLNPEMEGCFQNVDISELNEKYACVVCVEVLEHIPDDLMDKMLQRLFRCLEEDGTLIICVPTTNRPKHSKHFRHYNLDILKSEFDKANLNYCVSNVQYIWKVDGLKRYLRLTNNKFMYLRMRKLDQLLVERNKIADASNGAHMLAVVKKC